MDHHRRLFGIMWRYGVRTNLISGIEKADCSLGTIGLVRAKELVEGFAAGLFYRHRTATSFPNSSRSCWHPYNTPNSELLPELLEKFLHFSTNTPSRLGSGKDFGDLSSWAL